MKLRRATAFFRLACVYPTTLSVVHHSKFGGLSAAWGQSRRFRHVRVMSAYPPLATKAPTFRIVSFVPKADIGASLNNFVCAREQRGRNCEAERLSSLEIDNQLVLHRSLYWKVGRLLALEDAIDVARRAPKQVLRINAI
jgi:hypothetical protein